MTAAAVTLRSMEQGTPEWHAHRAKHRNASEAAAVMGCGTFSPRNPKELWEDRKGLRERRDNPAMARGRRLEARARTFIEEAMDLVLEPQVVTKGPWSASLDGATLGLDTILEVKVPWSGEESDTWKEAQHGRVPKHYLWQVQQQLLASDAKRALFCVVRFNAQEKPLEHLAIEVLPDPRAWEALDNAWTAFEALLKLDEWPDDARTDEEWTEAAEEFKDARATFDAAQTTLDAIKERLVKLAAGKAARGAGVRVTHSQRAGTVNYKAIPQLKGVDLEKFRGKPSLVVSVREEKEGEAF